MSNRLLSILAHPDDETLGVGGTMVKYANEGVETYLLTATRGERGRFFTDDNKPGLDVVAEVREKELHEAAGILKIKDVTFMDYTDGDLDQADPPEVIEKIAVHIREVKPHVILTFDPEGGYGHPDHIAVSQFAMAGTIKAVDPQFNSVHPPHVVKKFYYMAWPKSIWDTYQSSFKELVSNVDGVKRTASIYPEWMITTKVDATKYWKTVWEAVHCHKTQMSIYQNLEKLTEDQHKILWGHQHFYRVFSLVNGGRQRETDIFEGIGE